MFNRSKATKFCLPNEKKNSLQTKSYRAFEKQNKPTCIKISKESRIILGKKLNEKVALEELSMITREKSMGTAVIAFCYSSFTV